MAESIKTARFDELWHAWPRSGRRDLGRNLQGQILPQLLDTDREDSAIRLSAAFNRTGHAMPLSTMYSGEEITDKDGFKYCAEVADMKHLLLQKLGKPRHCRTETDAMGRRGIILFEDIPGRGGHFDLWREAQTAETTGDFFNEAGNVVMWELSNK